MQWFKFYGLDWMTDLKVMGLSMEDRLCFITLLCLSSQNQGIIKDCNEYNIIQLSHIPDDPMHDLNPIENAQGCLQRFVKLGMIQMITNDNNNLLHTVTLCNFGKRQGSNLTNYERVKKCRNKKRALQDKGFKKQRNVINDNKDAVIIDNTRIDKNRIDNIIIESESSSEKVVDIFDWPSYLNKMLESDTDHIRLLSVFFTEKNIKCENKIQAGNAIKRYSREASDIMKGKYADDKLDMAFQQAKEKYPDSWGLSTVLKYLINH
jgi:hypothetical protein